MLWQEILKYKELSLVNSQELILGSVRQEIGRPQRSDIMSSTTRKSMYAYVGLRTTSTPKTSEIVCLFMVNSWPLIQEVK